jgi:hypothetical protein
VCPEFPEWFSDFKKKRDLIKRGIPTAPICVFGTGGAFDDSLRFVYAQDEKAEVHLTYLATMLSYSRVFGEIAVAAAIDGRALRYCE